MLEKKNKQERGQDFKADMQTIKNEDVRKLQDSFNQYFGARPDEMKKRALKLKNKIYFFGFIITILFVIVVYLSKNVKVAGL